MDSALSLKGRRDLMNGKKKRKSVFYSPGSWSQRFFSYNNSVISIISEMMVVINHNQNSPLFIAPPLLSPAPALHLPCFSHSCVVE